MILRKLDQSEHGKTRPLWEEVFVEDTKDFLDYYYYIKTRDNQIYVVEEDGQICSMLQLNPYTLKVGSKELPSAYIIAVATRKVFRGRGFMGALLRTALEDMYQAKIPFTFLMPAAEAIYTPYDFRFIYDQCIGSLKQCCTQEEQRGTPVISLTRLSGMRKRSQIFLMRIFQRSGRYMLSEMRHTIRR